MGSVLRAPQTAWFVLDASPAAAPAAQFEDSGARGLTLVVTAPTLAAVLLKVISDPYTVFRASPDPLLPRPAGGGLGCTAGALLGAAVQGVSDDD